ncbi:uncharacterized protein LOC103359252 [Stegastes partitus]|uniref:Uncharacterized protein LOC103359252 n=1 Tax=Stegastes partitus TaxID=144197 RepID=A0A9Y4MUS6_9TELE|nr:PREDICTED: uncharacterized protein LOC103359252 [Stegastes partitus]
MPLQVLEEMPSKKRRPNWTDQESLLLAQLMQERKNVVRGKYSTGVSIQDKRHAWEEIAQTINVAFPQVQRTVSDCNKKWENLLAKAKEEIKRQKRQADKDDVLSTEQFSAVTQIVISVMNLSDMLQKDGDDSSVSELMETKQHSSDKDGIAHTINEKFSNKRPLAEHEFPTNPDPSISSAAQKMTFSNVAKSFTVQLGSPHAVVLTDSGEHLGTSCSTCPPSAHCTNLQERMDLEMSVLRRQEEVLKLQQEYYTLKIKLMKKQMEESPEKD